MIGCGHRQQAQEQMAQPLVGGQPDVAQQPVATPSEPSLAPATGQVAPQAEVPPPVEASPADEPPATGGAAPRARRASRYEREPYERAAAAPGYAAATTYEEPATRPQRSRSEISIPAGTPIDVRLEQTIDTKRNRAGDAFDATLTRPILVDERTVIPRGTRFTGHLIESKPSGRLKGRAELSLSLDSFDLRGRRYDIRTTHVARASGGHKKRNWFLIGGGSGFGSALGAIAGGPAGALIGAGAGAGAGTAGAVFTGKKNVRLPVETPLAFTLRRPVMLAN